MKNFRIQNAKCKIQNAEPTTTDARSKGRSKVYFDYALQKGRKWNIKPRAEGKLACAMPRCEGGKAYEVGLMQNAKLVNRKQHHNTYIINRNLSRWLSKEKESKIKVEFQQ